MAHRLHAIGAAFELHYSIPSRAGAGFLEDLASMDWAGCVTLHVSDEGFDHVAEQVNRFPEVAHNYQREHHLNMWFVLATETPARIDEVLAEIEQKTGCRVYNVPKIEEFFVGLRFEL